MAENRKAKLWWRIRGLEKMEERFGNKPIEKFIRKRLKSEKVVRVLELGFGEGKCLMDLREVFPDKQVELYGVNIKKEGQMHKRSDFVNIAKRFGVPVPKPSLLPKPSFYDAGKGLHYKSNYFDVIMSQVAFHYIGDKAKLFEEFWRVLKPNGKAFVNIDNYDECYPDFLQINKETPRFVIYEKGKLVKLSSYLKRFRKKGFNIRLKYSKTQRHLLMEKNVKKALKLGLFYDDDSSFNLTKFVKEKKISGVWWGTRSVFKVR